MKLSKALIQCYKLQDLLFDAANEAACSKADKARLALAWERLEERKRVLRGKPLPGSLKPQPKPVQRYHYSGAGGLRAVPVDPSESICLDPPPSDCPNFKPEPLMNPANGEAARNVVVEVGLRKVSVTDGSV